MFDPGRIESLEFQVRALKRMLFGVFALFSLFLVGGVVAATTLPRVPEVVRAKKFEVVHEDGQPVVVLVADSTGGLVELRNSKGRSSARLKAHPEGGTISTQNGRGTTVILLGANERGSGAIQTRNNEEGTLVALGSNLAGGGIVSTEDGKGAQTSTMP